MDTKDHVVDINRKTDVLIPETDVKGELSLPNKERLLFRIPENKSVLASELTNESRTEISVESTGREASTTGSSSSFRTHGHIYHERVDERRGHRRQRADNRSFNSEKKHRRHEHPPRTPVGLDRGDDRHEWEDTPLRESRERYSVSHRSRYPSRSPMLVGASPDARLVSPYQTPRFVA